MQASGIHAFELVLLLLLVFVVLFATLALNRSRETGGKRQSCSRWGVINF